MQRNRYGRLTESRDLRGDVTGQAGKVPTAAATTADSDSDMLSSTNKATPTDLPETVNLQRKF